MGSRETRCSFEGQVWNRLTFAILQLLGSKLSLIERLQSWDIGFPKISVPFFRHIPDKLSMPTALDEFKPLKMFDMDWSLMGGSSFFV